MVVKKAAAKSTAPAKKAVPKKVAAKKVAAKKVAKQAAPFERPAAVVDRAPVAPPTPTSPPTPRWRPSSIAVATVVLVVVAAILLLVLGAQERGGPPAHLDISIGEGIPATLYVPQDFDDGEFPYQQPVGRRPPLIVIAHGYSADRLTMSSMARSLARAGYATLAFDFRGHGSNTAEFAGDLRDDFDAVLDWAETSPNVDGGRMAVLGHSMGAGAALDFASIDPRAKAVIPISGGYAVNDVRLPPNVLFMVAEDDPGSIHDRQENLIRDLQGKTNVDAVEIGGNHLTILWKDHAIREIVRFLDPIMGMTRPGRTDFKLDDPRLPTAALYLLVALGLVALVGMGTGRLVVPSPSTSPATPGAYALLAAALVVTMPLLAAGGLNLLPVGATQTVVWHGALAGSLLWVFRVLVARGVVTGAPARWIGDGPWLPLRSVALPGAAAGAAIFLLLAPLGVAFHRTVPTTERLVLWVVVALVGLPFFAAFEALVRRGTALAAIGWGVLGRIMIVVLTFVGVAVGALPGILTLVGPALLLLYVVLEIFAATCYAAGRNPAVIAVVDAVFIAWIVTTLTPVS